MAEESLAQAVKRVAAIPPPRMTPTQFERLCSGVEAGERDAYWRGWRSGYVAGKEAGYQAATEETPFPWWALACLIVGCIGLAVLLT